MTLDMTRALLIALTTLATATGCTYTIGHKDVFLVRDANPPLEQLALPTGVDRAAVRDFDLRVDGRRFLGYRVASKNPARAVVFLTGNGYGASTALMRVATTFHDDRTDLYVISYMQPTEDQPRVGQAFAMAGALADFASKTSGISRDKLVAVGHSLGGWITLNLAGEDRVGCAVVVGSGTTAPAIARRVIEPRFLATVIDFQSDSDVALLDSEKLARRVRVPTMVVGSESDTMMPPSETQAIHRSLPDANRTELFVATAATHSGFFGDPVVLDAIRSFIRRRCEA